MISAQIILDSVNQHGNRITTWVLEYPRFIHSELMTHRLFSRNSASSRAIPITTMIETIKANPASPIHWGKNQAGMQAREELEGDALGQIKALWLAACDKACEYSLAMHAEGAHKQIANRLTEPFQHMRVVMTTTEHENWFWLRDHPDAQPEIGGVPGGLAKLMREQYNASVPQQLEVGEWHLPFVGCAYDEIDNCQDFFDELGNDITLEQAQMISSSCCAQVSFRKNDGSLEKAETIYQRLVESEPVHASPFEHQAMCIDPASIDYDWHSATWPKGITHMDRNGNLWSGNLKNWIQFRQLIPNNVKLG